MVIYYDFLITIICLFFADHNVQEEETGRGFDEEALQMNLAFCQGKHSYKI